MKKMFTSVFVVAVCMMMFSLFAPSVLAATPAPTVKMTTTPVASPTPVVYVLPYPGILPTHPLYVFKSLRDKIIELLITDAVHKADFYILQADKKLNMGMTLWDLKKTTEARAVWAEALASRTQAITVLKDYTKSGGSLQGHLVEKLMLSLVKHKEVLKTAGEKVDAVAALETDVSQNLGSTTQ